jgi:putative ABC transport system permease protein
MVRAIKGVEISELTDDLRNIMRGQRRLRPKEEDDFALNKASLITQGFEEVFKIIDLAGLLIGGLAILVGGFGIANIMFVSVKERTKLIGIQKSLGAKNYFILVQFLSESVMLSLVGGIVGLILVYAGTVVGGRMVDMDFSMSFGNVFSGVLISVVIGIISGFAPALSAAKLNPVEAINSNF